MKLGTRWVEPGKGAMVKTLREILERLDTDGRGEQRTDLEIVDRDHLQPYDLMRMAMALAQTAVERFCFGVREEKT